MQTFTSFFGGAFFGGEFFSSTPNVGGGVTGGYAATYLKGGRRTTTDTLLDRRKYGLDETFNSIMTRWGRPKTKE